jgi:DNA ligase-1
MCQGTDHLQSELNRVLAMGGEGLMLRQPRSLYEVGRSTTLFKVKSFLDAEAIVVEHVPGEGKHVGRLGALVVEMPNGIRFSVGTGFSDAERSRPPPVGSLITYRYQELTDRGVPRFPTFVRMRSDLNPPDLMDWPAPATSRGSRAPSPKPKLPAGPPDAEQSGPVTDSRRFEYVDEKSAKFWELKLVGLQVEIRLGRIGAHGQSQTKTFADQSAATGASEKLIAEKLRNGYREVPPSAQV